MIPDALSSRITCLAISCSSLTPGRSCGSKAPGKILLATSAQLTERLTSVRITENEKIAPSSASSADHAEKTWASAQLTKKEPGQAEEL